MSSDKAKVSPEDTKMINHIVDKLKKEGLFDQFRKECLEDVDTKPAYLNLRLRVENFVGLFLASQKWSPDNKVKNQLRDNLRKNLTNSHMLQNGVERIVEQAVNPKLYRDFKPQIDKFLCEYLGVDPKEREEKLRMRDEFERQKHYQEQRQKQKQEQQQNANNNQNPGFGSPGRSVFSPGGNIQGYGMPGMQGMPNFMDLYSQGMNPGMVPGIPNVSVPPPNFGGQQMPFMSPSFMSPPSSSQMGGFTSPGLTSHGFQQGNFQMPGINPMFPNQSMGIPGMPGLPGYNMPHMPVTNNIAPNVSVGTTTKLEQEMSQQRKLDEERKGKEAKEKEKKKEIEPLTVESLLNIPLPKQPPPESKKPEVKKSDKYKERKLERPSEQSESKSKIERESQQKDQFESDFTHVKKEVEVSDVENTADQPSKKYHFAWDDIDSGHMTDVTVSTIHTSDLSSFEDDMDADFEDEEDEDDETTGRSGEESMGNEETEQEDSPVKQPKKTPVPEVPLSFKPRKLIALQYNYSDSEDEESRLERKARIAKEKEDRYLRRQQRRAELEAKRKEVEEKRRIKLEERRQLAKEKRKEMKAEDKESEDEQKKPITPKKASPRKKGAASRKGTPRKLPTKEELKEQLKAQKVMEKRMALRRQRTRNKKYLSDEYESIFSERKNLFSNEGYENEEVVETIEQSVELETEVSQTPVDYTQGISLEKGPSTPTHDEQQYEYPVPDMEVVVSQETVSVPEPPIYRSGSRRKAKRHSEEGGSRPGTPHSDISDLSSLADSVDSRGRRSSLRRKHDDRDLQDRGGDIDRVHAQRYDSSDLYKPRKSFSRRRPPSPKDSRSPTPERPSYRGPREPSRSPTPERRPRRGMRDVSRSPTPERRPRRGRDIPRSPTPERRPRRLGGRELSRSPSPPMRRGPRSPPSPDSNDGSLSYRRARSPPSPASSVGSKRYDTVSRQGRYKAKSTSPAPIPPEPAMPADNDLDKTEEQLAEEEAERNRQKRRLEEISFGEAERKASSKKDVQFVDFGEAAKRARVKDFGPIPAVAQGITMGRGGFRPRLPGQIAVPRIPVPPGVRMPGPRGPLGVVSGHPPPGRGRAMGPRGRYPPPPGGHPPPDFDDEVRRPLTDSPRRLAPPADVAQIDPEFGEAARRTRRPGPNLPGGDMLPKPPPEVTNRPYRRGGISPRGGHDFHGPYHSGAPRRQWGKPAGPPDEHWSKYGAGVKRESDGDESYEEPAERPPGYPSPRKNISPRRPQSPLDEGEVEEEEEVSPRHMSRSPKRSISKSPARSMSPSRRSSSPEEGEVHHLSDGEATPSPPAKRLRAHSPPPPARRLSEADLRGGPSGMPPHMRRAPPTERNVPPMTRATRKRSEEEKLPPSKRLRNMNRM